MRGRLLLGRNTSSPLWFRMLHNDNLYTVASVRGWDTLSLVPCARLSVEITEVTVRGILRGIYSQRPLATRTAGRRPPKSPRSRLENRTCNGPNKMPQKSCLRILEERLRHVYQYVCSFHTNLLTELQNADFKENLWRWVSTSDY